jgi:hypothetical protein
MSSQNFPGVFIPLKKGQRLEVCEGVIEIDEYRVIEIRLAKEQTLRLLVDDEGIANSAESSRAS